MVWRRGWYNTGCPNAGTAWGGTARERAVEIADASRIADLVAGQTRVLEQIVSGAPLRSVLEELTALIEAHAGLGLFASILLLDADGLHLRHGAAPSLPEAYNRAIDGLAIGPSAGSCGTAAHLCERVVVTDIATDPRWEGYRELAAAHSCPETAPEAVAEVLLELV
jgi:hypothetical protein